MLLLFVGPKIFFLFKGKTNTFAIQGAASGKEDHPVGNMAILSVHHPRILEFVNAKQSGHPWKFNISVDMTHAFRQALEKNHDYQLSDNSWMSAQEVFKAIVTAAHQISCPGLIFMDRLNADNPVPILGDYVSVAPCAEVALVPGETCQFGYINLGKFIHNKTLDLQTLSDAVHTLVRALDNALELSINTFGNQKSKEIMGRKRKIGVGVCGLADALIEVGFAYASGEARTFAQDAVAFINYQSKLASQQLAKERGSFLSFTVSRHNETQSFIKSKYGELDTAYVTHFDWLKLAVSVRTTGHMRNCSTIALPPTGRCGLIAGASTGVEPLFNLLNTSGNLHPLVEKHLKSTNQMHLSAIIKNLGHCHGLDMVGGHLFPTAIHIRPTDHFAMVVAIQLAVDESTLKTINFPSGTKRFAVEEIYRQAIQSHVKGLTTYVDGTAYERQPVQLA